MKIKEYLNEKVGLFDKDPEYIISDAKSKNTYIVTSWTHGKEPTNIYTVSKFGNKWSCNCPSKYHCKHMDMVKEWLKNGKPSEFDVDMKDLQRVLHSKGVEI
jgi:hypothetical protein